MRTLDRVFVGFAFAGLLGLVVGLGIVQSRMLSGPEERQPVAVSDCQFVATGAEAQFAPYPRWAPLVAAHLVVAFAGLTWFLGRVLAGRDGPRPPTARSLPQASTPPPTQGEPILTLLQERTERAGEFVILQHVAEDLGTTSAHVQRSAAQARRENPTLEHRVVAGRWILRRPRL